MVDTGSTGRETLFQTLHFLAWWWWFYPLPTVQQNHPRPPDSCFMYLLLADISDYGLSLGIYLILLYVIVSSIFSIILDSWNTRKIRGILPTWNSFLLFIVCQEFRQPRKLHRLTTSPTSVVSLREAMFSRDKLSHRKIKECYWPVLCFPFAWPGTEWRNRINRFYPLVNARNQPLSQDTRAYWCNLTTCYTCLR